MLFRRFTIFQLFVFGFLLGIFVGDDFLVSVPGVEWILIVVVIFGWVAMKYKFKVVWLLVGISFGLWRFLISFPDLEDPSYISSYNGSEVSFQGAIVEEVDRRSDVQNIVVVPDDLDGLVLVKVGRYPEYEYGDVVKVYGELQEPFEFEDFSYKNYLARYGIYSVVYYPYVSLESRDESLGFFRLMFSLKGWFEGVLNQIFPEPSSSLAAGILLGSRRGIPAEVQEFFRITGLSHIVAISGYNITIVIAFVGAMLKWLPKRRQIIVASIFVVLFTLFVGASAAVVRASIMGLIALFAVWFGRKSFVDQSMLMAALLMNLWNPKILVYDVGFQLSFAATLGLIYVSPLLEGFVEKRLPLVWRAIPEGFCIRESIFLTVSAQVTALPIILLNFEQLSLISPIANMFVAVLIPWAMLISFGAVLLWWTGLGIYIGYVAWCFLEAIVFIAEKCSQIPGASVPVSGVEVWMSALYFILLWKFISQQSARSSQQGAS